MKRPEIDVIEQLRSKKRARTSIGNSFFTDMAMQCVWRVCVQEASWNCGATWVNMEGGWKKVMEILFFTTNDFGEDIWEIVTALGKDSWPRVKGTHHGFPETEVICAPPGMRAEEQIFQCIVTTATERSVRRLEMSYGSQEGFVMVPGNNEPAPEEDLQEQAPLIPGELEDTAVDSVGDTTMEGTR